MARRDYSAGVGVGPDPTFAEGNLIPCFPLLYADGPIPPWEPSKGSQTLPAMVRGRQSRPAPTRVDQWFDLHMESTQDPSPKASAKWGSRQPRRNLLRLVPGTPVSQTTRSFQVWEGRREYNVAAGCTAVWPEGPQWSQRWLNSPVGRLVQDLIYQEAWTSHTSSGFPTTASDARFATA